MIIYGVAFLALCTLVGLFVGELLGKWMGIPANVGGVGIAMLLLIGLGSYLSKRGLFTVKSEQGVSFWAAIYIPIVVAMAAQQDMVSALRGGPVAVLSAFAAAGLCACVIAAINRTERVTVEAAPEPMLHDNPLLADAE